MIVGNELQKIYLQQESYTAFLAQTALMIISLILALFSRLTQSIGRKRHLLYLTIAGYILSLIAFGIVINSLRTL